MPEPCLLALETSGRTVSVAVLTCADATTQLLAEHALPATQRAAKALLPAVRELLKAAGRTPADIRELAVASGPGSFTGLRIGITAAKTLAFATGAPLVGVNTLDGLAAQVPMPPAGRVWAVLDAQRQDVFAAVYGSNDLVSFGDSDRTQLLTGERWLTLLEPGDVVVGPVIARYAQQLPQGVITAAEEDCTPQASTVGRLGHAMLARDMACDPFQLVPQYHRLSAAEEKARGG